MRLYDASVRELRYITPIEPAAWIDCPSEAIPAPGRYSAAWSVADSSAPLSTPLFAAQIAQDGFLAAPPIPSSWEPGAKLELRGPLGRGFTLPASARRLALAALAETSARLLPLIPMALQSDLAVALFSDFPIPDIPSAVEIYPVQDLPEALAWADLLLLDAPVSELERLRVKLHLKPEDWLPCPAQALVLTAMPCSGIAECGACFVPGRHRWKQACQDGPVFDLNELSW